MPSARRSRSIAATPDQVWDVVVDPHHLARWWPRVARVEGVEGDAFTEVLLSNKGRAVRADFRVQESRKPAYRRWTQELEGTPFQRMFSSVDTEVRLEPEGDGASTRVTLELRQSVHGFFNRFGGFMFSRAARTTLDEALDGLTRIVG